MNLAMHLAILPVVLPLISGIVLLVLRDRPVIWQRVVATIATLSLVPLALLLTQATADGSHLVYQLGDWEAPFGIVLVADRLAAWMLLITSLLAAWALLYALRGTDTQGRHFHVLFQLQLFGLNGAFLTGDLFNLFVFFEILLLASYGLLLHGGGRHRVKSGLHFVVINLIGSTLFLFAVGTLYGVTGTLNMADLAVKLATVAPDNVALVESAALLLFIVFALKAALLPLHLWLPAAYASTSAPVAALFAIMTKVGAYSILRVYSLMFGEAAGPVAGLLDAWLVPLALATLVVGVLGALASKALRLQIAYLMVFSIGTLLLAFGLRTVDTVAAGLYYLPHSTFAAAAFFLLADAIVRARGPVATDRLESGPSMPGARTLGGLFFVIAVAVAGLPPLSGFLAKFMLLRATTDMTLLPWIWAIVLGSGLVAMIALARSGSLLFYRTVSDHAPERHIAPTVGDLVPVAGLLALTVGLVLAAGPLSTHANAIATQLLEPQTYIQAVLGGVR